MNALKIFTIALSIGAIFMACETDSGESCYRCTATDPNGQGTPVSSDTCMTDMTSIARTTFKSNFEAQHDPASYDISCTDI